MLNEFYSKAPVVSILIPIYNAENHLAQCLDSVVGQTLSDIEIVCINDGSTDGSLDIIQKYASNDSRIVIINKVNSGYGDSLNKGIERARGTYIGIIEADDFIAPSMYRSLVSIAFQEDAEIVKSDFLEYAKGRSRKANIIPENDAGKIIAPRLHFDIFRAQPSIWSAIYKKSFLESYSIVFTDSPGAAFQDTAFNLKTLAVSNRVWLTQDAYVSYRRDNPESSINSNNKIFAVSNEWSDFDNYMQSYPNERKLIHRRLQAVKFETYSWNLSRLTGEAQQIFYEFMHNTFVQLHNEGMIAYEDFASEDIPLVKALINGDRNFPQISIAQRRAKYAHNDI